MSFGTIGSKYNRFNQYDLPVRINEALTCSMSDDCNPVRGDRRRGIGLSFKFQTTPMTKSVIMVPLA
jgi:hypothetical protein